MNAVNWLGVGLGVSILALAACGGGGGGGGGGAAGAGNQVERGVPLADYSPLVLSAGGTETVVGEFSFDVIERSGPFESARIDSDELTNLMVSATNTNIPGLRKFGDFFISSAIAQPTDTLEVMFYLGSPELGDAICTEGEPYGPYTASVQGLQIIGFSVESITATQPTLDVINRGTVRICAEITANTPLTLEMDDLSVSQDVTCTEAPADMGGTWTGSYSCSGPCPEVGDISLTITQDGSEASYTDDGGASYSGTVCGNRFSYSGGEAGSYDESGTFVMNPDNTSATKTSTWRDLVSSCGGGNTCEDVLQRAP